MAQYMLSVHHVEGEEPPAPEIIEQMHADVSAFNEELKSAGAYVFAGGLKEPHLATVVREVNGSIVTTDGPFPESKEYLGGYWVIEAADDKSALEWAEKATRACRGPVEVRPFQDDQVEP